MACGVWIGCGRPSGQWIGAPSPRQPGFSAHAERQGRPQGSDSGRKHPGSSPPSSPTFLRIRAPPRRTTHIPLYIFRHHHRDHPEQRRRPPSSLDICSDNKQLLPRKNFHTSSPKSSPTVFFAYIRAYLAVLLS